MNIVDLDTLNREQLLSGINKALTEIDDSYNEVTNTADLWEWAKDKNQERHCCIFAAGLNIAKKMLTEALKAEVMPQPSIGFKEGNQKNTTKKS